MIMAERVLIPAHDHSSRAHSGSARVTEWPPHEKQNPQKVPLRCPRCDSTNTKFCYYNNYSLSQPRHFCKACKRYWTRGGTLRNVPVGGGSRKKKRVKKSSAHAAAAHSPLPNPNHPGVPPSGPDLSFQLYCQYVGLDLSGQRQRIEPPPSRAAVSSPTATNELLPQLGTLGLEFSSGPHDSNEACYQLAQLQQPLLHDYSLLLSSHKQSYTSHNATGNLSGNKGVKHENESGVMSHILDWQVPCDINLYDTITAATAAVPGDSSLLHWNAAFGAWADAPVNCGSSLAPLI